MDHMKKKVIKNKYKSKQIKRNSNAKKPSRRTTKRSTNEL